MPMSAPLKANALAVGARRTKSSRPSRTWSRPLRSSATPRGTNRSSASTSSSVGSAGGAVTSVEGVTIGASPITTSSAAAAGEPLSIAGSDEHPVARPIDANARVPIAWRRPPRPTVRWRARRIITCPFPVPREFNRSDTRHAIEVLEQVVPGGIRPVLWSGVHPRGMCRREVPVLSFVRCRLVVVDVAAAAAAFGLSAAELARAGPWPATSASPTPLPTRSSPCTAPCRSCGG